PSQFLFIHHPPPPQIYTLSLHDALPIYRSTAQQFSQTSGEAQHRCAGVRRQTVRGTGSSVHERPPDVVRQRSQRLLRREPDAVRSEEHTSELQSRFDLVCRLLLEKKNNS